MTRLIIALLLLATPAAAQSTICTQSGTVTICTNPDGSVTTCIRAGATTICS